MAQKYNDFKKEYARIKAELQKGNEQSTAMQQWVGQSSGIVKEACAEIGRRAQELKSQGSTGKTLKDFESDPEVKQYLKEIEVHLARTETELKKLAAARGSYIKKALDDFWSLKEDLEAEIAHRKKKATGFIKIKSASLPDMEKLLAELTAFKDTKYFMSLDGMVLEKIEDHRRDVKNWIEDALGMSKGEQVKSDKLQLAERALDKRILTGRLNRCRVLLEGIKKSGQDAAKAKAAGDAAGAKTALLAGAKLFKEMKEIAETYKTASEDKWIKARVEESKDKAAIKKGMADIAAMYEAASAELRKAI